MAASGYSVTGNGDLAAQLDAAIGRLPEASLRCSRQPTAKPSPRPPSSPPPPERHIAEGSFFVGDDRDHPPGRRRPGRAGHLRRHAAQSRRHHDRQAAGRPDRLARPRPPRAPVAERRLARGQPRRRPPRPQPRLRPVRRHLRPDQQDDLQRNRRRHASSAACPTW